MRRLLTVLALGATLLARAALPLPAVAADPADEGQSLQQSDDAADEIDRAQRDLDDARRQLEDLDAGEPPEDAGDAPEDAPGE
jgi:hypothetical protein